VSILSVRARCPCECPCSVSVLHFESLSREHFPHEVSPSGHHLRLPCPFGLLFFVLLEGERERESERERGREEGSKERVNYCRHAMLRGLNSVEFSVAIIDAHLNVADSFKQQKVMLGQHNGSSYLRSCKLPLKTIESEGLLS
jgi:hypothetical protein